ncbi:hypothetical protein SAMN05880501_101160 [Ureibacillus xyleni]|uniref:Uncharacterized protein n=1 Tax=Ureibacillus xyleni TaxID=614648 RepID=A0A285R971_9BACL|nr:hypothetical protein [Ureibacillus xyleni]SOB90434.1 hypothetical protein SAMN05880501_101160 [Ureibacillus xyleni]
MKKLYDEHFILEQLASGKTREELALELGHKDYRSLDMYMRRRDYTWDSEYQTYIAGVRVLSKEDLQEKDPRGKAADIIKYFQFEKDPKVVAEMADFQNHRALSIFMKDKGYEWDSQLGNYKVIKQEQHPFQKADKPAINKPISKSKTAKISEEYEELLSYLITRKKELADILETSYHNTFPQYRVPGETHSKSVQMASSLDKLVRVYCKEHNVQQKDIFQVALIEFFRKYGYAGEVKALIG